MKTGILLTLALVIGLVTVHPNVSRAQNVPVVTFDPSLDDGGVTTDLTPQELQEALANANRSQPRLGQLLERVRKLNDYDAKKVLATEIEDIIRTSQPKVIETLMRWVLERALYIVSEIDHSTDVHIPGLVKVENRIMTKSVEFAIKYYQSDLDYLEGKIKGNLLPLPYAKFGQEFANFLLDLDTRILEPVPQYNIAILGLKFLNKDLARDKQTSFYNDAKAGIYRFLQTVPATANDNEMLSISNYKRVLEEYGIVSGMLTEANSLSGITVDNESDSLKN